MSKGAQLHMRDRCGDPRVADGAQAERAGGGPVRGSAGESCKPELAGVSRLLDLYFSLEERLGNIPERQFDEAAVRLGELARRVSAERQAVQELAFIRTQGVRGLSSRFGAAASGEKGAEVTWAKRLRMFATRPSLPLFWETAAFLLGLAVAFLLT